MREPLPSRQEAGLALLHLCPGDSSPATHISRVTLLCCSGEVQGLLSQVLQLVRDRACSPCSYDPAASSLDYHRWVGRGETLPLHPCHLKADVFLCLGLAQLCPHYQGQLCCAVQAGCRAWRVLQLVRGRDR